MLAAAKAAVRAATRAVADVPERARAPRRDARARESTRQTNGFEIGAKAIRLDVRDAPPRRATRLATATTDDAPRARRPQGEEAVNATIARRRTRDDGAREYFVRYGGYHHPRRVDEWVDGAALRPIDATEAREKRARANGAVGDAGGGKRRKAPAAPRNETEAKERKRLWKNEQSRLSKRRMRERVLAEMAKAGIAPKRGGRPAGGVKTAAATAARASSNAAPRGASARRGDGARAVAKRAAGSAEVRGVATAQPSAAAPELTEDERVARTIRVNVPMALRKALLRDYEDSRGTDPRAYVAPRVTVANVLERFVADRADPARMKTSTQRATAARTRAIVRGFEESFNAALDASLLYKDEWHNPVHARPSEAYGATHLLRMLNRLSTMFPPESFADADAAVAVEARANDLLRFVAQRAEEFGVVAPDAPPAPGTPDNVDA